ncbi:hypothetical protein ACIHCM_31090 [Streptomyces sp. NPDC052023]|uniref:hypothetical protein n=1 Tax=Streptomyces sp. NPDC052023 TaxID=3365681 RepID=UPI0037D2135D
MRLRRSNRFEAAGNVAIGFCHCFRDLKMRREAVVQAQRAVDSTDPKYTRTLGLCRMVLARSQLLNGEFEAAVTTASLAMDGGDSLQSTRFQRYVTDFQDEVSVYSANPAVETLTRRCTTRSTAWTRTTSNSYQGRQARGAPSFRRPAMRRRYSAAVSLFSCTFRTP